MRLSILCIAFLISAVGFSQNGTSLTDKQYLELQDQIRSSINSDIKSAFVSANRIEKSDNYIHKVFAIGAKSYLYQIDRDSVRSKQCYLAAYKLLDKIPSGSEKDKNEAYLLNFGGLSEWKRSDFSGALDCFLKGRELSKKADDLIQFVKFNNNIALINSEVGNYKLAIKASKEMEAYTNKIEYLYTGDQFIRSKSNLNLNLGTFYEKYYSSNKSKKYLLDSAEYYYKKALYYSKDLTFNKINAKTNLGNIAFEKKDLQKAKNIYHEVLFLSKHDSNLIKEYYTALYDLGSLCFERKEYEESLVYFQKVDSIYKIKKIENIQYVNSNYYQAKIYNIYGDAEKASTFSKTYIESYEENELKLNNEAYEVNLKLNHEDVKKEMLDIQEKYKDDILLKYVLIGFLLCSVVILLYVKSKRDKKKINDRVNAIIEAYKLQQPEHKSALAEMDEMTEPDEMTEVDEMAEVGKEEEKEYQVKREGVSISLDEEKENEILEKLAALEKKQYYLKPDFTQQAVAKKIKTNTTYLSYVVNKKFNKSFSEYSNELKINYVINEMITNPVYRKYSTQAIAESVGFKNAVSFTKSFNKRTGVTPAQFVKRLAATSSAGTTGAASTNENRL
ncbi:helix-turn-helix domain-containing protein [Flavobacterium amniphilum]|uniref:helix-turn-helix domain-containing protein n=1 Tax=Flavobacterium amniphilum TaxID=1834035 RepID=UPI00202AA569|nr:helix-turn-helix domain-containing protein [Flavobacterium amniphilum]MCL9807585.1 helix-turn-helix domain-containing protein [Flavobacterium amniphilum]